jgi:ADP-L-glycero-D-manno-heptose 6-epimerase
MLLVTGGAGFIGSNLVAALEARGGHDIVVADRLGEGDKWRNIAKRELADIIRPEAVLDFVDRHGGEIEAVFHLGAISATTERDADRIVEQNFRLSLELLQAATVQGIRLVYASSGATYGANEEDFSDAADPASLARLRPLNQYGWSKHLFDRRLARLVERGAPLPRQWAGLKFFNVYGPNEYHKGEQRSVVAKAFAEIAASGRATLFEGDGRRDPSRDFVWVGDCVEVMLWLLDNPGVSGLFNVGSGTARSFKDLAAAVFAALDRAPAIEFVPMPEALRGRYQFFTEADISKLRAVGYDRPMTSLEDGVRRYIRNFLATDDPYA